MFYDPDRRRGGTVRHPQFHKVAERVGERVHGLGISIGIKPNYGWRHVFKSMARHVGMDREVEGFITGHRPKDADSGNDYGECWVQTMSAEIEKYRRHDHCGWQRSRRREARRWTRRGSLPQRVG